MKFQHLNIGQAFEYKGERYVKDGPIMAIQQSSGKKVMIPRSAELHISESATPAQKAALPESLTSERLIAAFTDYEKQCIQAFEEVATDISSEKRHALLEILKNARQRFFQSIQS